MFALIKTETSQAGFTLVELAIVMIIIGLLIGGVLQGQQMIANARVTSTVAEIESFEAAMVSFTDMYGELPGDIMDPGSRIPNCTTTDCLAGGLGNENGEIGLGDMGEDGAAPREIDAVGPQLMATSLLAGDPTNHFFTSIPDVILSAGFNDGGDPTGDQTGGGVFEEAHYIHTRDENDQPTSTGALRPVEAQQIDAKLDDGLTNSGRVLALGSADCVAGANYNASESGTECNIAYEVLR